MHINSHRLSLLFITFILSPALLFSSLPLATAQHEARGLNLAHQAVSRYYALVIGNDTYVALPKLKTAEADARALERLLRDAYGFQTKLLVNATRAQIVSALNAYRRELPADANLLIYYAGHGYNDKDADKAYWLPVDAQRDDTSNWIIADEITTSIRVIPAKHVLVISDSCYSGTLTRGIGEMLPRLSARTQFLQRMAAGHSRTLMASGGDEPVADSGGSGHSIFADALLHGLREMDKAQFTAAELFRSYVEESVTGRANQTPEYNPLRNSGHEAGDFVFVKVKAGDKPTEATVKAPPSAPVDASVFELEYWNAIKDSSDPEEYQGYLKQYPNGRFADIARRRARGGRGGNGTAAPPTVGPSPTGGGTTANPTSAARAVRQPQQMQNGVGINFVWVPAGSFMMGSETGEKNERPMHRVTIGAGFYMGKYEVTQAQWMQVMGNNPSDFKGDTLPVEHVSWHDAQEFIRKLNALGDGFAYRLPTEAEWEYAGRAGTTGDYAGELEAMAWYESNAKGSTHPVGQKKPNLFGLYDMHGNVWEWCADMSPETYQGAPSDGSAWLDPGSQKRILRGGSWDHDRQHTRSAYRHWFSPNRHTHGIGFRAVATPRTAA